MSKDNIDRTINIRSCFQMNHGIVSGQICVWFFPNLIGNGMDKL